jgi:hypothetical protein
MAQVHQRFQLASVGGGDQQVDFLHARWSIAGSGEFRRNSKGKIEP